jgi:hypothetical protein
MSLERKAKEDLREISDLLDERTSKEECIEILLNSFDVALSRLDESLESLRMIYEGNPHVARGIAEVLKRYFGKEIDKEEAKEILIQRKKAYRKILKG